MVGNFQDAWVGKDQPKRSSDENHQTKTDRELDNVKIKRMRKPRLEAPMYVKCM